MKIREHEGFQIHILQDGSGFFAEVYRKEKMLKSIRGEDTGPGEEPFRNSTLALQAATDWIDRTYSKRVKFKGYIQATPPGHPVKD